MEVDDVQAELEALRTRIEQLETESEKGERDPHIGDIEPEDDEDGVDPDVAPHEWVYSEGSLPPFAFWLFGVPPNKAFDVPPEAKTWTCRPEPKIVHVRWRDETREEHIRFTSQSFSVIRYTDSNTGRQVATATYGARLTATETQSVDWGGGSTSPVIIPGVYVGPVRRFYLRSNGADIFSSYTKFLVGCSQNNLISLSFDFPAGMFDLVDGARFGFVPWKVRRC